MQGDATDGTLNQEERLVPSNQNALISVDRKDRRSRTDMAEIIQIAEELSSPKPSSSESTFEEDSFTQSSRYSSRRGSGSSYTNSEGGHTPPSDIKDFIRRSVLPELMKVRGPPHRPPQDHASSPHTPTQGRLLNKTGSPDMTQKIIKLTRELHLLDGVDLSNLTISRERKLSRKIAQAYQEQQWKPRSIQISGSAASEDLDDSLSETTIASDLKDQRLYPSLGRLREDLPTFSPSLLENRSATELELDRQYPTATNVQPDRPSTPTPIFIRPADIYRRMAEEKALEREFFEN